MLFRSINVLFQVQTQTVYQGFWNILLYLELSVLWERRGDGRRTHTSCLSECFHQGEGDRVLRTHTSCLSETLNNGFGLFFQFHNDTGEASSVPRNPTRSWETDSRCLQDGQGGGGRVCF